MFWKRKERKGIQQATQSIFTRLLVLLQNKLFTCAVYLQQKTSGLRPGKLKFLLGAFCFLFVSSSAFVVISSLKKQELPFHITPIQFIPLEKRSVQTSMMATGEFLRIQRLRLTLDSLAKTPSGKVLLDSLLQEHPKLLDTLSLLEKSITNHVKK